MMKNVSLSHPGSQRAPQHLDGPAREELPRPPHPVLQVAPLAVLYPALRHVNGEGRPAHTQGRVGLLRAVLTCVRYLRLC